MNEDVKAGSARVQEPVEPQGTGVRERRRRALWAEATGALVVVVIAAVGILLTTTAHPLTGRGEVIQSLPSATPAPSLGAYPGNPICSPRFVTSGTCHITGLSLDPNSWLLGIGIAVGIIAGAAIVACILATTRNLRRNRE